MDSQTQDMTTPEAREAYYKQCWELACKAGNEARAEVERLRGLIAGWADQMEAVQTIHGGSTVATVEEDICADAQMDATIAEMRAEAKKPAGESVTDAAAEVERLKILGPDTAERVTCEARAIAAEMMRPALRAWKEDNEKLRAEVERLRGLIAGWSGRLGFNGLTELEAEMRMEGVKV